MKHRQTSRRAWRVACLSVAACSFGCTSPERPQETSSPPRASPWRGDDPVLELFRRVEREGAVEVRLAPGVQARGLGFAFLERLPWREALEVLAKMNRLQITAAGPRVLLLEPELTSTELRSERARRSMRINVDVEDSDLDSSEAVEDLLETIEGGSGLEVEFAESVDRKELWWLPWGSMPWAESLEVFAKMNQLRVTQPAEGLILLDPE